MKGKWQAIESLVAGMLLYSSLNALGSNINGVRNTMLCPENVKYYTSNEQLQEDIDRRKRLLGMGSVDIEGKLTDSNTVSAKINRNNDGSYLIKVGLCNSREALDHELWHGATMEFHELPDRFSLMSHVEEWYATSYAIKFSGKF